jgi:hypothetical protein
MSIDKSKSESNTVLDTGWELLIEHTKSEVNVCQERLYRLRKSLSFFTKQRDDGVEYPCPKITRHAK